MKIKYDEHDDILVIEFSGESAVVSAIRQIYAGTQTLPENVKTEAESFSNAVFAEASLSSEHRIQNSQELQHASWSSFMGQMTQSADGNSVETTLVHIHPNDSCTSEADGRPIHTTRP